MTGARSALAIGALALLAVGCVRTNGGAAADASVQPAASDTLRGVVALVGADPETMVALRPAGASADVVLTGPAEAALRRVVGAEVWVAGRGGDAVPRAFEVERFAVRAVDGRPARDGVLEQDGDALVVRTADGRRSRVVQPPGALRGLLGARVWIAGDADREPAAYGVIEPSR